MRECADAGGDGPRLNAMRDVAGCATWVSPHHGGGVGMGYSQHSGIVIVCDGTEAADRSIARVLWTDTGTGVMRHADAGYEIAKAWAKGAGLKLAMAWVTRRKGNVWSNLLKLKEKIVDDEETD